jgi:rhodanese-related sulfurtransferase/predicted small lipoprotein YifL
MNKKVLAVVLAAMMMLSAMAGCGAKEPAPETSAQTQTESSQEKTEEKTEEKKEEQQAEAEYQMVAPKDAVAKATEVHLLDVREWGKYVEGRVANSEWCPIFPLEDESLVDNMKAYADKNLKDGKEIYIICNSGARGAQKATGVLKDAGIDEKLIYTVEGGAKALADVDNALTTNRVEEAIEWKYAKGADVLKETDAQIVDVRDDATYAEGHLENSVQVALKEIEDAKAQTAAYELAKTLDNSKPVYFLCYSGNKCAKTAISIFKDAGFDAENLFIIENGAKDADIAAAFVK